VLQGKQTRVNGGVVLENEARRVGIEMGNSSAGDENFGV
jgi:hypothetical protein